MPRVPIPSAADQVAPSPGFTQGPSAAPPDLVSGQIAAGGRALQEVGGLIREAATRRLEDLQIAEIKEAQALAEERILELDRDYTSRLGRDATGEHRQEFDGRLQEELESISRTIQDQTARELFGGIMRQRAVMVTRRWNEHEDRQIQARELGAAKAVLEAKIDAARREGPAILDRQEPEGAPGSTIGPPPPGGPRGALAAPEMGPQPPSMLDSVRVETEALAARLGLTPEETAAMVTENLGRVHAGVLQDLVDQGRGSEAADYLQRLGPGDAPEDVLAKARRLVRSASVRESGARIALEARDLAMAEHRRKLVDPGRTEALPPAPTAEALLIAGEAHVQGLFEDGKISLEERDAALAEVGRLAKMRERETIAAERQIAEQAQQWLLDNPGTLPEQLPPSLRQQAQAFGLMDDLNRFASSGGRYPTDPMAFAMLFTPEGQETMRRVDPVTFATRMARRLSPGQLQTAMALYAKANGGDVPQELTHIITVDEQIEEAARSVGLLSRTSRESREKRSEEFANFHASIQRRIQAFELDEKRKATRAEIDQIIQTAAQDLVHSDKGFTPVGVISPKDDETLQSVYVEPDQLVEYYEQHYAARVRGPKKAPRSLRDADEVYMRNIPPAERAQIIRRMREVGLPVTEAGIAMIWLIGRAR